MFISKKYKAVDEENDLLGFTFPREHIKQTAHSTFKIIFIGGTSCVHPLQVHAIRDN
jgi:hypothetical protein